MKKKSYETDENYRNLNDYDKSLFQSLYDYLIIEKQITFSNKELARLLNTDQKKMEYALARLDKAQLIERGSKPIKDETKERGFSSVRWIYLNKEKFPHRFVNPKKSPKTFGIFEQATIMSNICKDVLNMTPKQIAMFEKKVLMQLDD